MILPDSAWVPSFVVGARTHVLTASYKLARWRLYGFPRNVEDVRSFGITVPGDWHECFFIVEGTFTECVTPMVRSETQQLRGHKCVGMMTNVTISAEGKPVHCTIMRPASRHDFNNFKNQKGVGCRQTLTRFLTVPRGRLSLKHGVLADNGFQGVQRFLPASVIARRKPRGRQLPRADRRFNRRLSRRRILVENFFGRMKTIFNIVGETCRGSWRHMMKILPVCVWLTGLTLEDSPLRMVCEHGSDDDERVAGDFEEEDVSESSDGEDGGGNGESDDHSDSE
jgi:hypothetical protein